MRSLFSNYPFAVIGICMNMEEIRTGFRWVFVYYRGEDAEQQWGRLRIDFRQRAGKICLSWTSIHRMKFRLVEFLAGRCQFNLVVLLLWFFDGRREGLH